MKIWRRLPPCVHLGAAAPYWLGLGAQTLIFFFFFGPSQGHSNETIAGVLEKNQEFWLGQLFWISLEAEPQTTSFSVPNQGKDCLLKAPVCQMSVWHWPKTAHTYRVYCTEGTKTIEQLNNRTAHLGVQEKVGGFQKTPTNSGRVLSSDVLNLGPSLTFSRLACWRPPDRISCSVSLISIQFLYWLLRWE